jgi:hypothetical protein
MEARLFSECFWVCQRILVRKDVRLYSPVRGEPLWGSQNSFWSTGRLDQDQEPLLPWVGGEGQQDMSSAKRLWWGDQQGKVTAVGEQILGHAPHPMPVQEAQICPEGSMQALRTSTGRDMVAIQPGGPLQHHPAPCLPLTPPLLWQPHSNPV